LESGLIDQGEELPVGGTLGLGVLDDATHVGQQLTVGDPLVSLGLGPSTAKASISAERRVIERTSDPARAGWSTKDNSLILMPRRVTMGSSPFRSGRFHTSLSL
jgi:hypothetical protein